MSFPILRTLKWQVGLALVERGPLTEKQLQAAVDARPHNVNRAIQGLCDESLAFQRDDKYHVSEIFAANIRQRTSSGNDEPAGEIVPPRVVNLLHCKPMTGYEARMRAACRQPLEDRTHFSGDAAPEKFRGVAL